MMSEVGRTVDELRSILSSGGVEVVPTPTTAPGHATEIARDAAADGSVDTVLVFGGDWDTRDHTCIRDFVHTEDLAQAHQLAVEKLSPQTGEIYNVGSGRGVTVMEVLGACEDVVGRPIPHEVVGRRPGDPAVLIASSEKLRRELGWMPRYPEVRDIVATAWEWSRRHPEGYRS